MSSVAKMIEISADSETSFDEALQLGIKQAGDSLRNIRSVWIKDQEVLVREGKAAVYRAHLKVTFEID